MIDNCFYYTGSLEPLTLWAINRGQAPKCPTEPPEPYRSWVRGVLPKSCHRDIGYWVNVVTPDSKLDGDWVNRYPHTHIISVGWTPGTMTVMTYLVAPDEGGEIAIGGREKTDPYTLIKPTPGLSVMVDAVTWHGVKPVLSGTRIALIASGAP